MDYPSSIQTKSILLASKQRKSSSGKVLYKIGVLTGSVTSCLLCNKEKEIINHFVFFMQWRIDYLAMLLYYLGHNLGSPWKMPFNSWGHGMTLLSQRLVSMYGLWLILELYGFCGYFKIQWCLKEKSRINYNFVILSNWE